MEQEILNIRIEQLNRYLEQDKLKFNDQATVDSLKKVRFLPDNVNVDPETVDGRVLSLALAVEMMESEEKPLSIPLLETQQAYFQVLDTVFGNAFEQMKKGGYNPHQFATLLSKNEETVRSFVENRRAFKEGLNDLWQYYLPVIQAHLRRLKGVVSVFGGDIFPSYTGNIAKSAGLYVDTILVPDPMLRTTTFFDQMPPEQAFYYLARHALSALQYKELALAELDTPIIVFVPDEKYFGENNFDDLAEHSINALEHLKEMFGVNFTDMDKVDSFLREIQTPEDLFQRLVKPDRMLFDTDWGHLSKAEQFHKWDKDTSWKFDHISPDDEVLVGGKVKLMVFGRMMQTNYIIDRASQYNGIPIVGAPTSWQYLLWNYEYSSNVPNQVKNMLISNSLTKIEYGLIGDLSDTALIKLRKENALNELRELLSKGIEEISTADNTTFDEVTTSVFANIQESFSKHEKEVQELQSRNKKFWGINLTNSIVAVGLDIAAAATGNSTLGTIGATLTGILGAPSVKELITEGGNLIEQNKKIKNSAVGILYSNRNR